MSINGERFATLIAAFVALAAVGQSQAPPSRAHALRTRLVLLGTGTPNADPDRAGPALAVIVDSSAYIVDAGAGIVRRAAAAAKRHNLAALGMSHLRIAFLTHLHSDHTVGLPDLMFSPWVLGRAVPLDVYGPPGTTSMVRHLNEAYEQDVDIRLHGGEPSNKTGFGGRGFDAAPGEIYRDSLVRVTAFEVLHGTWPHAYGYRFDTPDRSIVISGDTRPTQAVEDACSGCDILVHEVISSQDLATRSPEWRAYHQAFHTSSLDLGKVAAKAHPKLLVLYHQIPVGVSDARLIAEVSAHFRGTVVSGHDLDMY